MGWGWDSFVLLRTAKRSHCVRLIRCLCSIAGAQMLIYEFMPGGTLRDHLIRMLLPPYS